MRHSEHSEESKKGNIMGKMKEKLEEQEALEVIEAPEDITGDAPVEDKQEETEAKYKAKACIYYDDRKIMPGEIVTGVEANTIHSLLKNGFVELV